MSKESFKLFAQKHPELAENVISGKTNWQTLYELYDIYGEKSSVWNTYLPPKVTEKESPTFKDFFESFKNIDMESVQKGVTNIQKTLGMIQDIGLSNKNESPKIYEPRPIYQHFND